MGIISENDKINTRTNAHTIESDSTKDKMIKNSYLSEAITKCLFLNKTIVEYSALSYLVTATDNKFSEIINGWKICRKYKKEKIR
jgi:hypothetical protein